MESVKRNVSYQIIFRILTIITPLVTSPIISRAFGASGIGLYSATIAYVTYFTLFAMLGVEKYGNRAIAAVQSDRDKRSELFISIYSVQVISSTIAILAYYLSFVFIHKTRWNLAVIQSLWLFSYLADINWFFFGMEEFKLTVIRSTVIKIITVLLIVVFIRTPNDLYLYATIMGGGALLGQLVLWRHLGKYIYFSFPKWNNVKQHIFPILKLYIPVIAISIFRLMDKSMLDMLSTEESVGYYYSADKVVNIPLGLVTAVSTVMLPRVANMLHEKSIKDVRIILGKSIELTIILVSAVSFGIAAIAKEFVPVFFGVGYEPCVLLVYWFVPVLIIKTLEDIICSQYLIPAHMDNLYIVALFGGAAANIICNYFLIKQFAALGAVLGTLVAETVVLIIQLCNVKEIPFLNLFFRQCQYVLFGFIMFITVRFSAQFINLSDAMKTVILVGIGGSIYMLLCFAWNLISRDSLFHTTIRRFMKR